MNLIDAKTILAQARKARQAGADVVLVALHWGNEYQVAPTEEQVKLAKILTRSKNIDLVYGHHAHVVQPYRRINGKWVIFGLGNFLAGQNYYAPGVNNGVIAEVSIVRTKKGTIRVLKPTYVHTVIGSDLVVRPAH